MPKGSSDRSGKPNLPDLRTQLESLLDQVWKSEAEWRLWDRLDAAIRIESLREQRDAKRKAEADPAL